MPGFVSRILSRFVKVREEVRYIDFVAPPCRSRGNVHDPIRIEPVDRIYPSDDAPAGSPPHPDDDWFAPRSADDAHAVARPGRAIPEAARPSADDLERAKLDPGLVASLKEAEAPEPDDDAASAVTETGRAYPASDDQDWPFEDIATEPDAASPDHDSTALPAWSDEDFDLEPPILVPVEDDPEENVARRAGSRAAALVDELDLPRFDQRRRALRWLEGLLHEFPHGASHAAITRLVLSGVPINELDDAASIIRVWRSDSSLWLRRRFDGLQRRWSIEVDHRGRTALSWKQAAALVANVDVVEATEFLTTRWREAWFQLDPDQPGSSAYAAFACTKIARASQLEFGSSYMEQDTTDTYGWLQRLDPALAGVIAPDGRLAYHSLGLHAPERKGSALGKNVDAPARP